MDAVAEDASLDGSADNVFYSRDHVYTFELKIDESPEKAIARIRDRGYEVKYLGNGRTVHLIGVGISSKRRRNIKWKRELAE